MLSYVEKLYGKGFTFENSLRNKTHLNEEDFKKHMTKTGTTIVGVTCKEGVILAADTRATTDHVVEKNCNKIHFIEPNITCCGAGTAADCEYVTKKISAELELMRRNTGRESKVSTLVCRTSNHLFRYGGHLGAYLIVAGFDADGPHLVQIHATGFVCYNPFLSMGSGSLNAYAVLESGFSDDLTIEQAKQLAIKAIKAGIKYDMGSGSNVDFAILKRGKTEYFRNYEVVGKKEIVKPSPYKFIKNNIPVLKTEKIVFEKKKVEDSGMIIEE